jgi:hypothetical protein
MASGSRTKTRNEQVSYELTTWDLIDTRDEVHCPSTIVTNPTTSHNQWFFHLQNPKENIKLLADAGNNEGAMEIDISYLHQYYEILSKNTSELCWEIT